MAVVGTIQSSALIVGYCHFQGGKSSPCIVGGKSSSCRAIKLSAIVRSYSAVAESKIYKYRQGYKVLWYCLVAPVVA